MRPSAQDEMEDDLAAEEENKIINEEYKTWKKNAPYLYDLVITHALDWPSLTCQWFPDKESPSNKPYTTHRLLLGTHTSSQATDYLQIATVQIPSQPSPTSTHPSLHLSSTSSSHQELGSHTLPTPRIQIIQKIIHTGEVNRARYMPQNPDLIATKAVSGEVLVFDRTKHASEPERGSVECRPEIRLVGQRREGYGLAWNGNRGGWVLGGSEDMTVCHWDVNAYTKSKSTIEPLAVYKGHNSVVGDVDWHATKENIFASVGDDKMLMIWDTRAPAEPQIKEQAHDREILAVKFSPASEHLLITGSADKTIHLHDTRSPHKPLHTFTTHTDEVLHLTWSPHNPTIFASASSDRRVMIWDLSQIGVEQSPDDEEDGPPELVFVHGGHTARPTDFCWAPGVTENWMGCSTSEDNVIQVWQPTMRVWAGDEIKVDEKELEGDDMEGVESTEGGDVEKEVGGAGTGSGRTSKSMSISASASGAEGDGDDN
ncbi:hypothetical protein JAAARDRAFT_168551 [Jaapia argillacea MUCL 33604]|uniref:Histone-binding protein RBBP4-like N-terminal domain-containing protein n=1 Tax=Jaapia argillacea MUCL 33604 TaxID=933084 RepID=A0A067QA91_9AGAM|nr:hypothetical protein JAAARDRAFT_168551 [Jaapia argillacea MUCL 33604]